MPKASVQLNHANFTDAHRKFVIYCCDFHSCPLYSVHAKGDAFCRSKAAANVSYDIRSYKNPKTFRQIDWNVVSIHHYARSLEKYELKQQTWETAQGHDGSAYSLTNYMSRAVGWTLDRSALRHSCQLRERLAQATGEAVYFRPGAMWARNVEFGRNLSYPGKMRRFDAAVEPGFKYSPVNPYPYQTHNDTVIIYEDLTYNGVASTPLCRG